MPYCVDTYLYPSFTSDIKFIDLLFKITCILLYNSFFIYLNTY